MSSAEDVDVDVEVEDVDICESAICGYERERAMG